MFIQHMKIGARLGAGFSVILAILLVVTALGLLKLHRIADLQHDVTDRARSVDLAEQWAGLTGVNLARTLAIAKSAGNKDVDAFMQPLMKQTSAQISDLQKQLDAAADDARSKELMQDVGSKRKAYIDARNHVFDMLKGGDVQGALAATDDTLRPLLARLTVDQNGTRADTRGFDGSRVRQWGYNAANDPQGIYLNYIGSAGGVFQRGDKFAFDNPAAVQAFRYLVGLINADHVAPPASDTNDNGDFSRNQFLAGRMARRTYADPSSPMAGRI